MSVSPVLRPFESFKCQWTSDLAGVAPYCLKVQDNLRKLRANRRNAAWLGWQARQQRTEVPTTIAISWDNTSRLSDWNREPDETTNFFRLKENVNLWRKQSWRQFSIRNDFSHANDTLRIQYIYTIETSCGCHSFQWRYNAQDSLRYTNYTNSLKVPIGLDVNFGPSALSV